jgi:hypothetical protein
MLHRVGIAKAGVLLGFLVAADLVFLALHVLQASRLPWVEGLHFRIDTDQGFAELFQYFKLMLIVGLLGVLCARHRYRVAGIWAAVFVVILLDDALMLHERLGVTLASM